MSSDNLKKILKILHRSPCSQAELCQKLNLSKSHIHKLVNNLLEPGLIDRIEDGNYLQSQGRPRQTLKISQNLQYCSVLVIHTRSQFSASIYVYGHQHALCTIELDHVESADDFARTLDIAIDTMTKSNFIRRDLILSIVIATHATVEQGEHGMMYRNNNLTDKNVPLADIVYKYTRIRTFIYNFALGNLLSILHNERINKNATLLINCGEKSVALGIFLDNKIQLGRNSSFPECSHFPFEYGFEESLGSFNEHTEDALFFAIRILAPIYNITNVIITGSCFLEHQDALVKTGERLKKESDPRLHNINLKFEKDDKEADLKELVFLSFDSLVEVLDPQISRKNLEAIVSSISY